MRTVPVLLIALVSAWRPAAALGQELSTVEDEAPQYTLWVQPVGTVVLGTAGTVYASAGVEVAPASGPAIVSELSFVRTAYYCQPSSVGVIASVGPKLRLSGDRRNGFFVEPKLVVAGTFLQPDWDEACSPTLFLPTHFIWDAGIGIDIGYRFTLGPVAIEPVLGLAVGLTTLSGEDPLSFMIAPFSAYGNAGAPHLASALNLNLLRIGWTW